MAILNKDLANFSIALNNRTKIAKNKRLFLWSLQKSIISNFCK